MYKLTDVSFSVAFPFSINTHATCHIRRVQKEVVSAREETEQRRRGEIDREKELARGAEGTVSALSERLDEAVKEASEKATAAADLRTRLGEVQVRAVW